MDVDEKDYWPVVEEINNSMFLKIQKTLLKKKSS